MKLSPSTAEALHVLDVAWTAAGGGGLRISDAYRPTEAQKRARDGYEQWLNAARPSPGATGWRRTMKAAYVAPAGRSNHNWGGAIDIDIDTLSIDGDTSDRALAAFWPLAALSGFTPIITQPHKRQSESWHFDHLGALAPVQAEFVRRGQPGIAAGEAAAAGVALAGTLAGKNSWVRYVQARLNLGGRFCGRTDGAMGAKTRGALAELGISPELSMQNAINTMDEQGFALDLIGSL